MFTYLAVLLKFRAPLLKYYGYLRKAGKLEIGIMFENLAKIWEKREKKLNLGLTFDFSLANFFSSNTVK